MTTSTVPVDLAAARMEQGVKTYGSGDAEVRALDSINVAFEKGQFTALMGPSGSGKSTLLHCIAGLDTLTTGKVYVGATELNTLSDKDLTLLRREKVGFVFQAFNLIPTMTAEKNITLQRRLGRHPVDDAWFDTVVDSFRLRDRLHHRPSELSGGQQQRVAVARALINKPDIIFADEPTGNLDSTSGREVLGFLRAAVDDLDQTVVMVTHDPAAAAFADRVIFLVDGRIVTEVSDPTTDGILDQLKQLEA